MADIVKGYLGRYAPMEAVGLAARQLGISYGTARNRYLRHSDRLSMARQRESGDTG